MRHPLYAHLALIALLGCGLANFAGTASADPTVIPPAPPMPPMPAMPPVAGTTASVAGTLVIPATCLDSLSIVGGADPHIVSSSGSLKKHGERVIFTTSAQDCAAQDNAIVTVPAQTSIEIQSPHNRTTSYRISGINGEVTATSGRGDLEIDQANGLTLNMEGTGDVMVRHVTGRLAVQNFASGDLHIDSLAASTASLTAMSSGDIRIDQGDTDVLTVRDYGSVDIVVNTNARDADVTLLGSGDITLQKISETLKKRPLGSGTISVAQTSGARITTTTPDGSAILSDTTKKVLGRFHIQLDNSDDDSETAAPAGHHHSGGHGIISLLLKIFLIIWAVRLFRRYRRTGVLPFRGALDKAASGYAGRKRHGHHEGYRPQFPKPAEDLSCSVAPGHPLARLQDRLARMERRLGLMEQFVTSPDFSLERQFRDLERTDGRRA